MSKLKHTHGTWEILPEEVSKNYIRIRGTQLGGRYRVCNVLCPTYDGMPDSEIDETRANAKLISRAPEMLDALIDFVKISNKYYGNATDTHIVTRSLCTSVVVDIIERATGLPIDEVLK